MSAPTAADYRAALARLDECADDTIPPRDLQRATFAVARAAVAERAAASVLGHLDIDESQAVDVWCEATEARDIAVAALVALAKEARP